jgi:nickel-dependent lactate racemase
VDDIRPALAGSGMGHVDAPTALVVGGGVPRSAPDTELVVVVNDPDRATSTAPALRAIREAAPDRAIHVVVATGSHVWSDAAREVHQGPLREAAGSPATFSWHDGTNGAHADVGGVRIDAIVAGARDVLGVGSVEPHWFAGLTGAHKTLTVGVMHRDDIAANHAQAMSPACRPFRLAGNPVHEGIVRAMSALADGRHVRALQHANTRWFSGPPLECLADAAKLAEARWKRLVARPLDFAIAVVAPPLSRTLYQAEKGVKHCEFAVKDGGMIVLDAECEDGVGPDRFVAMLREAKDVAAVEAALARDGYRLGDHKAHRLRALQARGVRLAIVSTRLPREAAVAAGFTLYATRKEAANAVRGAFGGSSRGAVIEDAGHVVVESV